HSGSASRPSHRKQQTRGASTKRPLLLNTAGATSKTQQEQRQRHSRANAAAAIAQNGGDHGSNLGNADSEAMETYSGLRISDRTVSAQELRDEMEGRKYIQLGQMDLVPKDTFTNGTTDWLTIGVLIRKTLSKPTANGSTFMVWGLSDLTGTELGVFLFDDAYAAHWKELTGSVVALMNAALLPATEKNKFAFKASQRAEIVKLGKAVDFGICKGPKNISAGVYTSSSANGSHSGWNPIFSKKRKRNDAAGGILGVPTVLSASGAVVQRGGQRARGSTLGNRATAAGHTGPLSLVEQMRQPAALSNAPPSIRNGGTKANPNKRASRGQQIMYVAHREFPILYEVSGWTYTC
ncbi:hypothetical protein BBJ28_00015686, partial [Nothophytophthora sp. Chile5]